MKNTQTKKASPDSTEQITQKQIKSQTTHVIGLIGLAVIWFFAFILFLVEHARAVGLLLPLITLGFIGYGAWVTIKIIRETKRK